MDEIRKLCAPLIEEARQRGMLLWNDVNCLYVSANALERLQGEGKFLWGPTNWKLVEIDSIEVTEWGSGYLE